MPLAINPDALPALTTAFREQGYIVIDDFLSQEDCNEILGDIDTYRKNKALIRVDRPSFI